MLRHVALGPFSDGKYAAAYQMPGCNVMALARMCTSHQQALEEAARLNAEQLHQEAEIQRERALCGLRRIAHDLRDI